MTELPPKEAKFENFYIRYSVGEDSWILEATVWQACEWTADGRPVFFNAGPRAPGLDPTEVDPVFDISCKWDGCSHLHVRQLHFDQIEEFESFSRCVAFIWDELCEQNGVSDPPYSILP